MTERITVEQDRHGWATETTPWAYPGQQDVSTMGIFEARESAVRSYCRTWPKVFDRAVDELILEPRHLNYRLQFPGPGGTNAVEAALKLARKVTGRTEVVAFTDAFHGMTLGALAVTGSEFHRGGAGVPLAHAIPVPFGCRLDGNKPGSPGIER
jgi:4-aminobutyrate aminotransferase-like enzyme